jgi:hypothetical protein
MVLPAEQEFPMRWLAVSLSLALAGCGAHDDETSSSKGGSSGVGGSGGTTQDAGQDASSDALDDVASDVAPDAAEHFGPTEAFERFCSAPWEATIEDGTVGKLTGEYLGAYQDLPTGTIQAMNIIPEHPFRLTTIRVAFARGNGNVRIRLTHSFGGSQPDLDHPAGDLLPPQEFEILDTSADSWIDLDVSEHEVFLEPTKHYAIVYEQIEEQPLLALEDLPEGESSRAIMLVPGEPVPYGSEGNFRMELGGQTFCRWDEPSRFFGESIGQPFAETIAQYGAFTDLDGDGNVDIVLNQSGPTAFLGDGKGGFSVPAFNPFPDTPRHTLLVFADIDNDGHVDAFAGGNVSPNRDGDPYTLVQGDCNDADPKVHPGMTEIPDNGIDDDCDGVVDDGTSTEDADSDGFSVADGDCDDTRDDVHPGAVEKLDGRDNDCDGLVDEDFVNRILLNDGTGVLAAVDAAGVEVMDPTAAAAFGDGNGDGVVDLYWGNWLIQYPNPPAVADVYMEGKGDGVFSNVSVSSGIDLKKAACYGVRWNDYDNDGDQDIWVGNYGYGANLLWTNDGTGKFTDVGYLLGVAMDKIGFQGGNTFGGDFGDIDNDGDLDLYAANIAHPRYQPWSDISMLLVNQGPPDFKFTEERAARGLSYDEGDVNAAFADFDNDMHLDLAVASLYGGHYSRLYRNDGTGRFTNVTYEANVAVEDAVTVAWADVDKDGDLDLLVVDRSGANRAHLFINRVGQDRAWVQLDLRGTTTNRGGVGARVTLKAGGVTQIREVRAGGGHNVQSDRIVHFGLGDNTAIDEVTVRWVGGVTETITGLEPRRRYRVEQGSGVGQLL